MERWADEPMEQWANQPTDRFGSPVRPKLPRNLCIFCQNPCRLPFISAKKGADQAQKPEILSVIVSICPLFSSTSPDVPSFLTSLWFARPPRATFRPQPRSIGSCCESPELVRRSAELYPPSFPPAS